MRTPGPALLAAILYTALALIAQRSLLPGLGDEVYAQSVPGNDCLLHTWILAWDHHALASQPLNLFDANIFYPHERTLLYSDHLLGLALVLAPLRLITDNALAVHNLATLAAPALDALALYGLVYHLTGQASAALIGGFLYGFAPFRFEVERCQIQMLAAWWLPLVFLLARRAVIRNSPRDGVLAGVVLALQGLTGIYLTAFLLPFLLLAHVWWLRCCPLRLHRRGWTALLLAETGAALLLLPVALAYSGVQDDLGISRSTALNGLLSLRPVEAGDHLPLLTLAVLFFAGMLGRRVVPEAFRTERWLFVTVTLGASVLALGPVISLPGGLGQVAGPYAALLAVPGFDALRAPARMVHLALLGMTVVAAGGFAVMTNRLRGRGRALAATAVLVVALAEYRAPRFPTIPAPPPATRNPVYGWLARQPTSFRFVEIPIDPHLRAGMYQYASTVHWKRTLNGTSALLPPVYPYMAHELRRFPDLDVLALLSQLDINHVVVHAGIRLPRPVRERLARMRADPAAPLRVRYAQGNTFVFALTEDLPRRRRELAGARLDRSRWNLTASHGAAGAPLAIDADPKTSWTNYADLEDVLNKRWYDPLPLLERWRRFLDSQPTRLEVDLGQEESIWAVVMRLGGSDPTVAPRLVIEASTDAATWTRLRGDLDPLPDVRALVKRPADARFALRLRAATQARFLRLSCDGLEWRLGDLDVYAE